MPGIVTLSCAYTVTMLVDSVTILGYSVNVPLSKNQEKSFALRELFS